MVAIIHASSSLRNALNYNERKVKEGVASCLEAGNYPKDVENLSFYQKLNRLENLSALNLRTKVNSVHISLNFDPSEKLSTEQLKEIADLYLTKIGFVDQPYLLYQHHDAGHPHLHIVTTNINADGGRIELHNLGRNQSEKARKEIEQLYGLKPAEKSKLAQGDYMTSAYAARVQYGKLESKKAIQNVLSTVVNTYKYTSLAELNAVLKQYNVTADRGSENSRIYNNHGLVYRILDEQGNKVGVPIKASLFYSKPTLKYLEENFASNHEAREPFKARVKNAVDLAFLRHQRLSLIDLTSALKKEGINTVIRQNKDGIIYGLTYVDHKTKCVFNGSDLSKAYSAKGVMERCKQPAQTAAEKQGIVEQNQHRKAPTMSQTEPPTSVQNKQGEGILQTLVQPEQTFGYVPGQLTNNSRKRKKKRSKHL